MKSINTLIIILIFVVTACSDVDNYSGSDSGIYGTIIDNTTNEGLQTEQPNGIKISLVEAGYESPIPINTWAKADGSYENANLFANTYKVIPVEGAFVSTDTVSVKINGRTELNFTVTPFLTIEASVQVADNSIISTYTISRSVVTNPITQSKTICSVVPNVSCTINEFSVTNDLSSMSSEEILSKQFSDEITGLTSGKTYYVRVAAKTSNANNKYNYSPIFKVTIP
jgi:hypothetical protein